MSDMKAVSKSLANNGNFGDATDVIFDGFEVRAMTSAEKAAVAAVQESTQAGGEPAETPSLQTLVQIEHADAAKGKK